jgi:hypothetical protein
MEHLYIQFKAPGFSPDNTTGKRWNSVGIRIIRMLLFFIPRANPDFEKRMDYVAEWLLEIDTDDNSVVREIGLDKFGRVIMILPLRKNYGFWLDTDMGLDDFIKNFDAVYTDKSAFESKWDEFIKYEETIERTYHE